MIKKYPDKCLRVKCKPCTKEDIDWIKSLTGTVEKILRQNDGIGLAAPQLGYDKRFFWFYHGDKLELVINPVITWKHSYMKKGMEGCLSIPKVVVPVRRPYSIKVEYEDIHGNRILASLSDFDARVFQHEYDHLDGILIIDKADKSYLKKHYPQFYSVRKVR